MNSTFMFGEDNFSESEDFSIYYHKIGGALASEIVNNIIRSVYSYLDERYAIEKYRRYFPSLEDVLKLTIDFQLSALDNRLIVNTFAHHEIGHISEQYCQVLRALYEKAQLALVIDIWAPKSRWTSLFIDLKIESLFAAASFSSDHGMVKPSPKPFELVLNQLGVNKSNALVVGDSIRRDLGGAQAAGLDCVLVGGAQAPHALASYENLIDFVEDFIS